MPYTSFMLYTVSGYEAGRQCADYVATIDIFPSCASTMTDYGYERLCMWDDLQELLVWACEAHDIDPWFAFLAHDGNNVCSL